MGTIVKPNNEKLNPSANISIPAMQVPNFRAYHAIERGYSKKMLFLTRGGVGDYVCAEPAFRWAMETFKGHEFYLASLWPELFSHLPFTYVWDLKKEKPYPDTYYEFPSFRDSDELANEFTCHMAINPVNYIALSMWRCELPLEYRAIKLVPSLEDYNATRMLTGSKDVIVHCGRTKQSRTFPASWWNAVLMNLKNRGLRPVLIGGDSKLNETGTVKVNAEDCLDLRCKLTLLETAGLLHDATVLLTNDSMPLHMAASGPKCWIGFISTVKHPDLLLHYRPDSDQYGYRMENFSLGGMWETMDFCPSNPQTIWVDKVDHADLISWLPDPSMLAEWAHTKILREEAGLEI